MSLFISMYIISSRLLLGLVLEMISTKFRIVLSCCIYFCSEVLPAEYRLCRMSNAVLILMTLPYSSFNHRIKKFLCLWIKVSICEKELSLLDLLVIRLKHKIRLDPNNMKQLMLPCYSMILLYRILNEFKILKFYRNALYLKALEEQLYYLFACMRAKSKSFNAHKPSKSSPRSSVHIWIIQHLVCFHKLCEILLQIISINFPLYYLYRLIQNKDFCPSVISFYCVWKIPMEMDALHLWMEF